MPMVCYFLYFPRLHAVLIYGQNLEEGISWGEGLLLRQGRRGGGRGAAFLVPASSLVLLTESAMFTYRLNKDNMRKTKEKWSLYRTQVTCCLAARPLCNSLVSEI